MVDSIELKDINLVKKSEAAPKEDTFLVELKKWRSELTKESICSPYEVWKRSSELEEKMDISGSDKKLMGICSSMMELFKDKGRRSEQEYKRQSVTMQQNALKEVTSRLKDGKFLDDKAPEYFLAMNEVFASLKHKGVINGEDYTLFAGLRGMISAALLFSSAGFTVEPPEVDWDANHDIDLLVSKSGKNFSVSVKSEIDHRDPDTGEEFTVKGEKRPSGLPQSYYDKYVKHIWINIPNQTTEDGRVFCEQSFKARAIGLPCAFMTDYFKMSLGRIRIPE